MLEPWELTWVEMYLAKEEALKEFQQKKYVCHESLCSMVIEVTDRAIADEAIAKFILLTGAKIPTKLQE